MRVGVSPVPPSAPVGEYFEIVGDGAPSLFGRLESIIPIQFFLRVSD